MTNNRFFHREIKCVGHGLTYTKSNQSRTFTVSFFCFNIPKILNFAFKTF